MPSVAHKSVVWHAQPLTEADIFTFALNLEFLECVFYTYAVKVSAFSTLGPLAPHVVSHETILRVKLTPTVP